MNKLYVLSLMLFMIVPAFSHEGMPAQETLEKFFPEADNFVSPRKSLTPQPGLQVEQVFGDKVQAVDKDLAVYFAIANHPQTNKLSSIRAVGGGKSVR